MRAKARIAAMAVLVFWGLLFSFPVSAQAESSILYVEIVESASNQTVIGHNDIQVFIAVVHALDENNNEYVAKGSDRLSEVKWSITGPDGESAADAVFEESGIPYVLEQKYVDPDGKTWYLDGCNATYLYIPYGSPDGFYNLIATSAVDSNRSSKPLPVQAYYSARYGRTLFRFSPGSVDVGGLSGSAPAPLETFNNDTGRTYTVTLPSCTWSTPYYRFVGWRDEDGSMRRPGERLVSGQWEESHTLTAVWELKFQFPRLFRAEARGTGVRLSWRRVIGGGYTIYRAAPGKKFRKVKTVSGDAKTSWTDKRVKSGKTYRYKIAAWKAEGGRRVSTAKGYAIKAAAGGRARANAKKVTVSKASVAGKVGGKARLKAKVAAKGGKAPLSKKVRWYSSDESVARVGKSTGKVTLLGKGRCTIWAKSHNGVNSRSVAVTVS